MATRHTQPTLNSIARAVGVSRQTVSNVINSPERVAPATREAVQAEIARVGYRPSAAARQLRTHRSRLLGFRMRPVLDGINGSIHDRLLHALTTRCQELGYSILLFDAATDSEEIGKYAQLRASNALDGFFLTSTNHGDQRADWLLEHEIPFITFGRPWGREDAATARDHDWVDIDGGVGTAQAVEHLRSLGAERIGFIGWPEGSGAGDDRFEGYCRALMAAGLPIETPLIARATDSLRHGAEAASRLLDAGADGIVCVSDSFALGAVAAMRRPGTEHLLERVIGFDATPVARAAGITSVDQPIEAVARRMADRLIQQLDHPEQPPQFDPLELLRPTLHCATPALDPATPPT